MLGLYAKSSLFLLSIGRLPKIENQRKPYPSDLSDAWAVLKLLLPAPKVGHPQEVD